MIMFLQIFLWYLALTAIGLICLPLSHKVFNALSDKGYIFSRTLGLFLWGFIFWLLSNMKVIMNTTAGILVSLGILAGISAFVLYKISWQTFWLQIRSQKRMIINIEAIFAIAFLAMALFRAINPDIIGTEKPMELAFINAILQSPTMPPADPWLSGYAISYYYFGFVLVAMLAKLTGIAGGIAFNLGIATVFALTAIGTYGVVYNLLMNRRPTGYKANIRLATLGFIFVLLAGNATGFLEILHANHIFWNDDQTSAFWEWLDIEDLRDVPTGETSFSPRTFGSSTWCGWCWRSSRVIQDYDYLGNDKEIIDEFPAFSFVLADLHPHVLSLPFTVTSIALALNIFLKKKENDEFISILNWIRFEFTWLDFIVAAIYLGGAMYLNFWDFPVFVGFFSAAYTLRQAKNKGWSFQRLVEFISLGMLMGISGAIIYAPFLLGFSSQAGGFIPNIFFVTRGIQYWVMFGTLLIPILAYLTYIWIEKGSLNQFLNGYLTSIGLFLFALVFAISMTIMVIKVFPLLGSEASQAPAALLGVFSAPDLNTLLVEGMLKRLAQPGTWLTLILVLGLGFGLIYPSDKDESMENNEETAQVSRPLELSSTCLFAVLLVIFGGLVTMLPDFVYLRDLFGYRINSVFKFYYQGWMFWGLAAAICSALLIYNGRKIVSYVSSLILTLVLIIGLAFSAYAVADKIVVFQKNPVPLTLDGTDHLAYLSAEDKAAIDWLTAAPYGVVAEAIGGSYSGFARISAHSGYPTILGWEFHEIQWRGGTEEMGSRNSDIRALYETSSWEIAEEIIQKYDIEYIYVGSLEQNTYQVNYDKFDQNLNAVFFQYPITIYATPEK